MHGLHTYIMIFKVFDVHEVSFAFPLKLFTELLRVIIGYFYHSSDAPLSFFLRFSYAFVPFCEDPKSKLAANIFHLVNELREHQIKNSSQIRKIDIEM